MSFNFDKPIQLRSNAQNPLVNFSYKETRFRYPHAWHEFIFSIYDKESIKYNMETGQILLYAVGKSALKTEELSKSYQKALTPEGFIEYGEKVFSEIIERFPKGSYQISIQTIPEPYLIWPNMVKEAGDGENTDKLFSLKEKTATPNLLLPTQCLSSLCEDIVEKYLDEVDSGAVSYPLLLKEPHNIARLHEQYHPKGYDIKCSPPNFGFNGNHLYFEKRNYYILDGHHRLAAYELIQKNPIAIVIDYQGPINL